MRVFSHVHAHGLALLALLLAAVLAGAGCPSGSPGGSDDGSWWPIPPLFPEDDDDDPPGDVAINEVDCNGQDHVELLTSPGASLAGLVLREGDDAYALPAGSVADDDGRFVVAEVNEEDSVGFNFGIPCDETAVVLSDADGHEIDSASMPSSFPGAFDGTTWCRVPDGATGFQLCTPTLGEPNAAWVDPEPLLFDPFSVTEIRLDVGAAGAAALETAPREYVEGTFTLVAGGDVYGPVSAGIALKGNAAGSFRPLSDKAAFKVKFNEFLDGNRFLGLKGLKLNNMVEDPSQLHEAVAYRFFAQLGVPAARAGYARVIFNGDDYGLHAVVERIDDVWASRHFADTQHVLEGTLAVEVDDAAAFDIEAGPDDLSDLAALAGVAAGVGGAFVQGFQQRVDVQRTARSWMGAQYLFHWDGYAGATNNYYLHSDDDGRFTWIPSGLDQSISPSLVGLTEYDLYAGESPFNVQGRMFHRCRSTAGCDVLLDQAVDELAVAVAAFDSSRLIDDISSAIDDAVAADPRSGLSIDDVHAAQQAARQVLVDRIGALP